MVFRPVSSPKAGKVVAYPKFQAVTTVSLTVGAFCACALLIDFCFYSVVPSVTMSVRFIAYVLVFNMLPGALVTNLLLPKLHSLALNLISSLGVGIAVNLAVLTPLWMLNETPLLACLPVITGVAMAFRGRRFALGRMLDGSRIGRTQAGWICGTLFVAVTSLLSMANFLSADPSDAFSMHFAFQGVIVRGLQSGWEPPNLLNANIPLSYNYAAHLWTLGASSVTSLPLDVLVARYVPVFLGGSAASMMLAFGRRHLDLPWWIAALAVACVFWIVGLPPITAGIFGTFMPFGATLIMSPFLAIILFFVILTFILDGVPRRGVGRFLIISLLAFLATGARGTCPPILVCALALRLGIAWLAKRRLPATELSDMLSVAAGLLIGLRVFFTLGTGFSGTGFVHVIWQPFDYLANPTQYLLSTPHTLINVGFNKYFAGTVAFLLIVIFQAGFLTPMLAISLKSRAIYADRTYVLLIGSAIAGAVAVFTTEAPGYSQISFLYFSNVSMSLLASRGLSEVISKRLWRGRGGRTVLPCLAGVLLLACLQLAQMPMDVLRWFETCWIDSWAHLTGGSPSARMRIEGCLDKGDSDLFARARSEAWNPIVILLPKTGSGHFYCQSFWMVVNTPIQVISNYATTFIMGSSDGALGLRLASRAAHMDKALALASDSILSGSEVRALADTLGDNKSVLVLADKDLESDDGSLQNVASSKNFTLWRMKLPNHQTSRSQAAQ